MMIGDKVTVSGLSKRIISKPVCDSFVYGKIGHILDGPVNEVFLVKLISDRFPKPYRFYVEELTVIA